MSNRIKKIIALGVVVALVGASTFFIIDKNKKNKALEQKLLEDQNNFKIQLEQHQKEASHLTDQLKNKNREINNLKDKIKKIEAQNKELEEAQQNYINVVGYMPSKNEIKLLENLVECEAGGESLTGKIAVVNVVLNRVKSNEFPDTITGVIFQKNQFEPVSTGVINKKRPSKESVKAVKMALQGKKVIDDDILYFWAKWLDRGNDLWNHVSIVDTIGVHNFGRAWIN